jgi:hypothetical protein
MNFVQTSRSCHPYHRLLCLFAPTILRVMQHLVGVTFRQHKSVFLSSLLCLVLVRLCEPSLHSFDVLLMMIVVQTSGLCHLHHRYLHLDALTQLRAMHTFTATTLKPHKVSVSHHCFLVCCCLDCLSDRFIFPVCCRR